jgi:NAD(P)-dependent dehydrogenase (short-subunit alcohol dehydrogenase family)
MDPSARFRLDGRTALITGASSGIGAELARGLAAAGAHVVLGARRLERVQALAAAIAEQGGRALPVVLDVTDRNSIRAAFDTAEAQAGPVRVLVNNAGIAEPSSFLKTTDESLRRVMETNFFGAWNVAQEAAQRLAAAGHGGSIINVASVLGLGAAPGYASYAASKAALVHLTRNLALEFSARGIRVNAIAPGWFETEMNAEYFASEAGKAYASRIPGGRLGRLEELVGPVLLLASDAGAYVSGAILPVDHAHSVALV